MIVGVPADPFALIHGEMLRMLVCIFPFHSLMLFRLLLLCSSSDYYCYPVLLLVVGLGGRLDQTSEPAAAVAVHYCTKIEVVLPGKVLVDDVPDCLCATPQETIVLHHVWIGRRSTIVILIIQRMMRVGRR